MPCLVCACCVGCGQRVMEKAQEMLSLSVGGGGSLEAVMGDMNKTLKKRAKKVLKALGEGGEREEV